MGLLARLPGGLLLLAVMLTTLPGCGSNEPGAAGSASTPGTSLFHELGVLQLLQGADHPRFDPDGAALLTWVLKGSSIQIPSEQWVAGADLPRSSAARLLGTRDPKQISGLVLWSLTPPVDLDLPPNPVRLKSPVAGPLQLSENGLPQGREKPLKAWHTNRSRTPLVWWNHNLGRLEAASRRRPLALSLAYPASLGPFPTEWQWWADEQPVAQRSSVTLGAETREVVGVPASSRLAYETPRLDSAALDVGFALTDLGVQLVDGEVRTRRGPPPSVTFAVEIHTPDGQERVFEQEVSAGNDFGDARLDLAAWKGRACRVDFVVEGAPPHADLFAMWSTPRFRDPVHDAPTRPHIVILDLDTLRADRLGCYGHDRPTSPHIDAWAAKEAVLFRDHTSVGSWTLPSTVTMLTGLAPNRHGVFHPSQAIDERHEPLAQRLAALGYETLARTEAGVVTPPGGFDTGFERFLAEPRGAYQLEREGWEAELDWMRRRDSSQPMFVFLQTYNIHGPFVNDPRFDDPDDPYTGPLAEEPVRNRHVQAAAKAAGGTLPERDARYLRDVYDAGIQRVDESLGPVFEALPEIFGDEPYVVVLTSDHGEELAERGVTGHGHTLHRELFQTPLIVSAPGQVGGSVVDAPVSSLDLVPTLLALAGAPRDPTLPGRDLFADQLTDDAPRIMQHDAEGLAVQVLDWRLIDDSSEQARELGEGIYDLGADPLEQNPLEDVDPSRRQRLVDELRLYLRANPLLGEPSTRGGNEDAALLEQLRELGYIGDD
ncbi:MAG: hypothetical protein DHS20C15_22010 [Planctomycetota bacterium]|nr:MAG: hypothetical protein DHS20C15_22010 [Planctomycetota bacterium]